MKFGRIILYSCDNEDRLSKTIEKSLQDGYHNFNGTEIITYFVEENSPIYNEMQKVVNDITNQITLANSGTQNIP